MNTCITLRVTRYMVVEYLTGPAVKILLYIYEKKKAFIRQLSSELTMSNTTVYNQLLNLTKLGLVTDTYVKNKRVVVLTEKGKLVASKLLEIEKILSAESL